MSRLLISATLVLLFCVGAIASPEKPQRLVVHEWGTFTSFQDENGRAIGGLNNDEEPLPPFVRTVFPDVMTGRTSDSLFIKSVPRAHPDVTMRLETPVLYFYPAEDSPRPFTIDVSVDFKGGWLTQFYPGAHVKAPGLEQVGAEFGPISRDTVGNLTWDRLIVGADDVALPRTDQRVWIAPREVAAAPVKTAAGEGEKFLFYRGVGNLEAPLTVTRDSSRHMLKITGRFEGFGDANPVHVPVWLADIRKDGSCAFRPLVSFAAQPDMFTTATQASFNDEDYEQDTAALRAEMRTALIGDGLFADEADALLNTWEASYFKAPGLRLFFLVPRPWTDAVLPLKLSREADVVRSMVGRIEIVAPQQREIIRQIATAPLETAEQRDHNPLLTAYHALGRFANALVLDEARQRPTPSLEAFIKTFSLRPYTLPTPNVAAAVNQPAMSDKN